MIFQRCIILKFENWENLFSYTDILYEQKYLTGNEQDKLQPCILSKT